MAEITLEIILMGEANIVFRNEDGRTWPVGGREDKMYVEAYLAELIAGERNPDSPTAGYLSVQQEANLTTIDASGGDVTDSPVSAGQPALLLGYFVEAGAADTLTIKDGVTQKLALTVAAGDASAKDGVIPPGVGLRLPTSLVVSLTTNAVVHVYWRPL